MNPLTNEQFQQLTRGGECLIHTHPREISDFQDRLELAKAMPSTTVSSTSYIVSSRDELLLVDTTSGATTIQMPVALNGREYTISKTAGAGNVNILPASGETVLGSSVGITFSNIGTTVVLKAVTGLGFIAL